MTCFDSSLWRTIDLRILWSDLLIRVDTELRLSQALMTIVAYGHGNITSIVFHPNLPTKDEHLNIISRGCPHLKRLVMPCWDSISVTAMSDAINNWGELESITMPSLTPSFRTMLTIDGSCERLSQLKVVGVVHDGFLSSPFGNFPFELKVLSLQCCLVPLGGLLTIMDMHLHLEVLNLSHVLLHLDERMNPVPLMKLFDNPVGMLILEKAFRLSSFFYCEDYKSCNECRRMMNGHTRHSDGWWRLDEVASLNLRESDDI
ncbi:unnamed protein product [Musa acuminata subsp. malaccensis]|uniref:(wild Malaysian banana) hypothetical protein n=1 Tax=Musa acuminata subsp. malaccensis TaxID=214687 RepID=A0A804HSN0_MUSAM|nr:PREDICTED: F-box/LRR-repeat protein At3g48880-like [Musa acuminata subsp. malaccensis]CAG1859167.1 unnamed protein product [Musa acuminata subsp. malaccensis]